MDLPGGEKFDDIMTKRIDTVYEKRMWRTDGRTERI